MTSALILIVAGKLLCNGLVLLSPRIPCCSSISALTLAFVHRLCLDQDKMLVNSGILFMHLLQKLGPVDFLRSSGHIVSKARSVSFAVSAFLYPCIKLLVDGLLHQTYRQ